MTTMTNPADRRIAEGYAARHEIPAAEFDLLTLAEAGRILAAIVESDGLADVGAAVDVELASLATQLLMLDGKATDDFVIADARDNGAAGCAAAIVWALRVYSRDGDHTFAYVREMAIKAAGHGLSAPQLRGLFNCIRAEALRDAAAFTPAPVAAAAPVDDDPDAPFADDVPAFRRAVEFMGILSDHGLKNPKVRLTTEAGDTVAISIAGATSRFPGSLNVTDGRPFGQNVFYGRIDPAGNANAPLASHPAVMAALTEFVLDPESAMVRYGRATGSCAICGRELTNKESIERGIGPVCAEKGGL